MTGNLNVWCSEIENRFANNVDIFTERLHQMIEEYPYNITLSLGGIEGS